MSERLSDARVLIYSHDSFGLGHLRRCRAIAHSLVDQYKGISVLILSGSPIIGSFDFRARVDFVRIPGVIKLYNGEYTSAGLHIDLHHTLAMRSSIIHYTADIFKPDLFLVDKEPLGLNGEVVGTIKKVRTMGTKVVLGLRDIMDDPESLKIEWEKKNIVSVLNELYDEIWIYGLEQMGDPLKGIDISEEVKNKIIYTGYLKRGVPQRRVSVPVHVTKPYILVTAGGGGDGEAMIDWIMSAYEQDSSINCDALIILGPFMSPEQRSRFHDRAESIERVQMTDFDSQIETLMDEAEGVIAMGGYNTFCEILSLNKRALLIPRSRPRREQTVRAARAQQLGLARMLSPENGRDPKLMAEALKQLPKQPLPSASFPDGLLDGLEVVNRRVRKSIRAISE